MQFRQQDRPWYNGAQQRQILQQLHEPATARDVSRALGWEYARVERAIHHLRRAGRVLVVGVCEIMTVRGPRKAQQYRAKS